MFAVVPIRERPLDASMEGGLPRTTEGGSIAAGIRYEFVDFRALLDYGSAICE